MDRQRSSEVDRDDEPPLLVDRSEQQMRPRGDNQEAEGASASIMDEMLAAATKAKHERRHQQDTERNRKDFGAGLKKGFLGRRDTTRKAQKAKSTGNKAPSRERLEVDETLMKKKEESLLVVNNQNSESESHAASTPFVFPEVQDALKNIRNLNPSEWMNERFYAKLAKHPKLLQALRNPRFSQALNELQQNPQKAMVKYQRDADVSLMLRDFLEFLGSHFEELGKEQGEPEAQQSPAPPAPPAIVDLDAVRRDAISKMERSPDEEQQVQRILQNPELMAALSDARLMELLRRGQQDARALQELTRDPILGSKLRLLADAGLVRFG